MTSVVFRNAVHDQEEEEHDEEEEEEVKSVAEEEEEEEETSIDDGQPKPFTCSICSVSFSKFEGYREHFISSEHRYRRRDEKKRLGVCCKHLSSSKFILIFSGRLHHRHFTCGNLRESITLQ